MGTDGVFRLQKYCFGAVRVLPGRECNFSVENNVQ